MAQDVLGLKSQGWQPKQLPALLLIEELESTISSVTHFRDGAELRSARISLSSCSISRLVSMPAQSPIERDNALLAVERSEHTKYS